MIPWVERPTIDVDLAQPEDQRFAQIPPEVLANVRPLLAAIREQIPPSARLLADGVRLRTANRFHAEAVSMARRMGLDWREIILANISYDLVLSQMGCSTVALPTPQGPVLARNMDWWPEDLLARASYLIRVSKKDDLCFVNAGWPGAIGVVSGMSARGFAVVLNAVSCSEPARLTGYPVLLHVRRVVEDARGFEEARELLATQTLTSPALFTLVGRQNHERVVIERTPTRHVFRLPEGDAPLFTTNDYRLLDAARAPDGSMLYGTACGRYEALQRFYGCHTSNNLIDNASLLYRLTDPSVLQGITCQHVIFRPATGEARLFVPRRLLQFSTDED